MQDLKHLNVSDIVKQEGLHSGFDSERECYLINEDKVCDHLEELLKEGGCLVDTHSLVDYFPERWFDLVICLTVNNTVLYDRLTKRGYPEAKIKENVECEIMQVLVQEAQSSYDKEIVQVLRSETIDDLEANVDRVKQWYDTYLDQHK